MNTGELVNALKVAGGAALKEDNREVHHKTIIEEHRKIYARISYALDARTEEEFEEEFQKRAKAAEMAMQDHLHQHWRRVENWPFLTPISKDISWSMLGCALTVGLAAFSPLLRFVVMEELLQILISVILVGVAIGLGLFAVFWADER